MKTYNVGILGFGMIGKVHAYGYLNLPLFYDPVPLRARITHVVTSRQETAEKARQTIGADVAGTDYRAVTENPAIDIVHICTPNHLHKEALLSAIAQGKHIYCDKPLVATMAEAEEIEAALAGYRGTAQMAFQNRFFPATMRAKQLIDEGAIGEVLGFRACYLHGGSANPDAPLKWKLTSAAGGGVIADLGSHVLDLVDWLIGPIGSVMAATQIAYPERPSAERSGAKAGGGCRGLRDVSGEDAVGRLGTIEATKTRHGHGGRDSAGDSRLARGAAIQRHGPAPPGIARRRGADQPLGGLRGWNRIDAGQRYPAPGDRLSQPEGGDRLDSQPRGLLWRISCRPWPEGRPAEPDLWQGIRVQHMMECLRRSAAEKRWVDVESVPQVASEKSPLPLGEG